MKKLLTLGLFVALLVAACGGSDEGATDNSQPAPETLTGVITEVQSTGLTDVESFTLSVEGESYEIFLADDIELGFPPAHLNEHRTTGDPVRVDLEERSGKLYATSIEDA